MKVWIVIVAFVATSTILETNAAYHIFENVMRAHIYSPTNDMLFVNNYTEDNTDRPTEIRIEQTIDKDDNPLMVSAKIVNEDTGSTILDGGPYNVCEDQDKGTLDYFAWKMFQILIIPPARRNQRCPAKPKSAELSNKLPRFGVELKDELDLGNYSVDYSAKTSKDQVVFSSAKFTMSLKKKPEEKTKK